MCGCAACSWPLAFQDRHTGAFSCASPINTTRPGPPSAAALAISGRAICSLFSPLAKCRTGTPVRGREPVNFGDISRADLPERRRGGNLVPALPAQVLTHPAHRLQLRHIGLQEDPVHRTTGERDVITQ